MSLFLFLFFLKYELIPVNMTVFFHARLTFQWRDACRVRTAPLNAPRARSVSLLTSGQPPFDDNKKKKKKNPIWLWVCARKRKGRDLSCTSVWSASFHRTAVDTADCTGLHLQHNMWRSCLFCAQSVFRRSVCLKGVQAQSEITAWLLFFFSLSFLCALPSLVSGMQDTQHHRYR